jgi:transposase
MLKKTVKTAISILFIVIFSTCAYAAGTDNVASLDNKNITIDILTEYVKDVAGKNYEPWLYNRKGLRKLADFYINRTLLLTYAKQTVDKKDLIVKNHSARSVDADVMILSALLQKEVQDKVQVSDQEVLDYMLNNGIDSEKAAKQALESNLKNDRMNALIKKVRRGHTIEYF